MGGGSASGQHQLRCEGEAMTMIRNPILPGFNPDPSICRVGEDYYIATSTFEWYPGVQIHHSRDLANWRLVRRPLDRAVAARHARRARFLRRLGARACRTPTAGSGSSLPTSSGSRASFKDAHNYIATAPAIEGPWSDPIYVNSSGFDPSLFHDDDGRKWFLNMIWDHRARRARQPAQPCFRRHPLAGMGRGFRQAGRLAQEHFRRQPARSRRRAASL